MGKFGVVCVFCLFLWWTLWYIEGIGSGESGLLEFLRTTRPCTGSVSCFRTSSCGTGMRVGFLWPFYSRCTLA